MTFRRIVLATGVLPLAIAACGSSGSNDSSGGDGGASSNVGNSANCGTIHACQLLTDAQINAVTGAGADAGQESNVTLSVAEDSSCIVEGPTGNIGVSVDCGALNSAFMTLFVNDASTSSIPNLGMQAISVGDNKVYVTVNSTLAFDVVVTAPDGGSPPNAIDTAKTLASGIIQKL